MRAHFATIGSTRMKKAMKEVGIYDDTKLELKSFELNPMEKRLQKLEIILITLLVGERS
nr:hypothetical protein [Lactobacillus kefiranofaciens]